MPGGSAAPLTRTPVALLRGSNAANKRRAHPSCNCKVVVATSISYKSYVKLFGKPGPLTHRSIDLRSGSTRKTFEDGKFAAHHQHP